MTGGDYVDRKQADRIIVKSNARMKKVLDWYLKNREWLDNVPCPDGIWRDRVAGRTSGYCF